MRSYHLGIGLVGVLVCLATPAAAQQINPAIYVDVDTSGSMLQATNGTFCYGDGSTEHPHNGTCASRISIAKSALTQVVSGFSEVRWGLARFQQRYGSKYLCMCTTQADVAGSEETDSCDITSASNYHFTYDLPSTTDRVCINYSGGWGGCASGAGCCDFFTNTIDLAGADILVALAEDNESTVLMWLDGHENDFRSGTQPGTGNHCYSGGAFGDCELRGAGGTPIAGSLQDLYTQLSVSDIGADAYRGCRPYSVILLTDGEETCNGNPEAAAAALRTTPDLQHTCTGPAQCPPNTTCSGGRCVYDVRTYVIGFALDEGQFQLASDIAAAGGTHAAVEAWDANDIAGAMAQIIAESLVAERCNDADDDCDGQTDEDFPVGDTCNNGGVGACYAVGSYICNPADDTAVICDVDPGTPVPGELTEVCNGIDDDCDGQIDEGGVCTCDGPELCNGFDDYCDLHATHAEGSQDPNVGQACGTDVGRCTVGTTYCWVDPMNSSHVEIRCSGIQAIAEVCDANVTNNDQNCNGVNNDGIAPTACQKTNANGTCNGLQTCDVNGTWTCWARDPAPELCNNVDDNCNGQVDELLSRGCQVTNAAGTCPGTETCSAGTWVGCNAPTPVIETCDNADNNCDGRVDENLTQTCQVSNGNGTCSGIATCVAGSYTGCTARTPAAEICNNLDDDCDGSVDENLNQGCYSGPSGTQNVGLCRGGTQTCATGTWGACAGQITPTTEVCDGDDNDCDGQVDENLGSTTCGLGICQHTVQNCTGGTPQSCDPYWNQGTETCNNLDDDCDGVVDGLTEGCYSFGSGCTLVGQSWVCQGTCRAGTHTCPAGGGGWGTCQFEQGPGTEVCDGQDNDCDGSIDENLSQACYPLGYGPATGCTGPGTCTGACRAGTQACAGGAWGTCSGAVIPSTEVCDAVDNDCDGQVDEDLTQACQNSNGFGTCSGTRTCALGTWGTCTAPTPVAEICNNVDDDCDGAVDENVTQPCYGGPNGTAGVGACRAGTQTCAAGSFGTCQGQVMPGTEVCDGVDNDCDGTVDEGSNGQPLTETCYTGPAGTEGTGACHAGVRTCTGGAWTACQAEVVPAAEVCDGADNDCDGAIDENLGTTTCGLGHCQHTVDNCLNGTPQTCDPYAGAQVETCDGVDNDCDGVVDGITRGCYGFGTGCTEAPVGVFQCEGTCAPGLQVCASGGAGTWGECLFDVGPLPEACDGLDNDCDGQVDEDAQGDPLAQTCYPPGSGPQTGCLLDAGTGEWTCTGLCQVGSRVCATGVWGDCLDAVTPAVESCDGSDNDCDGQVDEPEDIPGLDQPCSVALGRCTPGILRCENGVETCEGGAGPFPGECNAQDDDCDGEIDEPDEVSVFEGQPCGDSTGMCEPGETLCVGGGLVCVGGVLPGEEVCDGQDNDCDGEVDDHAECPPEYYCVQGDCRSECDPSQEFPCPGSLTCQAVVVDTLTVHICLPPVGECNGVTCPDGWNCVNGVCVDPCDPDPCQSWEECHQGTCVDVSCSGVGQGCEAGAFCVDHVCLPDPCATADCDPATQYCVRDCADTGCTARCQDACACPPGQRCDAQGACQPDPCFEVTCDSGDRCAAETGVCEPDPCFLVGCPPNQRCFEGECVADPCRGVTCPAYFHCEVATVDDGAGGVASVPQCRLGEAFWVPGDEGEDLTLGGSGCTCQAADDGSVRFGLLLVLLTGLGLWRRRSVARRSPAARRGALAGLALPLLLLLSGPGCDVSTFNTGHPGHWEVPDGDVPDGGGRDAGPDAAPDACVPAAEVCDGIDNDCDGVADNGIDLATDPYNCGACGTVCEFPYAFATCDASDCVMGNCFPGHWDNNASSTDGCEYACQQTSGGVETCDGIDNDCDGVVDDGFDLDNDVENCGQCNRACAFFQGVGGCIGGDCVLATCRGGYVDKDGNPSNGCECMIALTEGPDVCDEAVPGTCAPGEVCADADDDGTAHCSVVPDDGCDGVDNDCDGEVDEDASWLVNGGPCYTQPVGCTEMSPGVFQCAGTCQAGVMSCVGGDVSCNGQVGPAGEICDGLDNDCNGVIDDGFDKLNDPANCGGCGVRCATQVENAVPGCAAGQCLVIACLPGFRDVNGDPQDGCEYACTLSNGGVERCGDGVDNDCNGHVDDGFDFQADPTNCGTCGNDCSSGMPFGTSLVGCTTGACRYACLANHHDRNGDLALGKAGNGCEYQCTVSNGGTESCDSLDNDCDGLTDEGFDKLTDPNHCGGCNVRCADQVVAHATVASCTNGVCQFACVAGYLDRNGDLGLGSLGNGCEYQCTVTNGGVELCDGQDNDCDGQVDEAPAGGPLTQACYTGAPATQNVGLCHGGTQTCSGGGWGACLGQVLPAAGETCDGLDNDCDGQTDEAPAGGPLTQACYTGPAGTQNVGLCHGGSQSCTGGAWGACGGQVVPTSEVCDTLDNDCDASVDEGFTLQTDVLNCGACSYSCVGHAGAHTFTTGCVTGQCQYACQPGYHDLNGDRQLGSAGNGCEYACTLTNGGVEACGDSVDNDCDGLVDEGFTYATDVNNCGSCGYSCVAHTPFGATATGCATGQCQYACQVGYYDLNSNRQLGDAADGCEYQCTTTNGGTETCDNLDNDCDGQVDEDFLKQTNVNHCGTCNYRCSDHVGPHSTVASCSGGVCQFACALGWVDLNGDVNLGNLGDGCEYGCTASGAELCDGLDNDCDGQIDEAPAGGPLTQTCYTGPGGTLNVGVCHAGTQTCSGSAWGVCQGQVTPTGELCDGLNNDCDGQTDEDFTLATDLNNCGQCGRSCWTGAPANTYPDACAAGTCHYTCLPGFSDLNNDRNTAPSGGNGCEYTCPVNPPGDEYCDGKDNDCDGSVDEGLTAPAGLCYPGINGSVGTPGTAANNPCLGVTALCQDPDGAGPLAHGWYCQYPTSVEKDPANPNQLRGYELLCNGMDGDCDGTPDDNFGLGADCDNGRQGGCKVTGAVICHPTDPALTTCNLPAPGTWPVPASEVCDGEDNDCDGLTDETQAQNVPGNEPAPKPTVTYVVDEVDTITLPSGRTSRVYTYEASRPTSTIGDPGTGTAVRACSKSDVIPWSFVTHGQAAAACARAGMRLCTADEWTEACNGQGVTRVYPYGDTYVGGNCNGHDQDAGTDAVEPTGTQTSCLSSGYGIEDLSGNLREWTTDVVGTTSDNQWTYRLRGGGYLDTSLGLRCDFTGSVYAEDALAPHVGFRCCSSCGNGFVDTWEDCDPSAGSPSCSAVHCVSSLCGNGTLDAGEECDDGNNVPGDGCSTSCRDEEPPCGNGVLDGMEECDDGNQVAGDGCDTSCFIEWVVLIDQPFTTCPPTGWTITDGLSDGRTWQCCPSGASCTTDRANDTGSFSGGSYMMADSDEDGNGYAMDEYLRTPTLNLTGYQTVTLRYNHYYRAFTGQLGYVQYSINNGSTWTTLVTYSGAEGADSGGVELWDVSAQVAGYSQVIFRFYFDDGTTWGWYWMLDDIEVRASEFDVP